MEILEFLLNDDQIFTTITLAVLIALFIGNIVTDKLKKYEDVDANGAIALMDEKNLIILDVREAKERKAGYIAKDTHIPLSQVKNQLDSLDNSKKILVYCRSGSRSSHIAGLLTRNNFEQVYNLKGGMLAWQRANLPIKK
ncbi:MAG TPA: rhodanese-like domain-containing protein [Gammaproteobacteria bacterium]|jgi:rhodanese-related sulfurtransferase|uniref:Rhodanese-like protein n=1 Tax=hydrothermal vent metagenome TaxID=652676 RepID=A0A1W1DUL1_9ZZZZ|nr:rhodanese-like domain-containing protein [Gammaproteobacteria bacterium]HAE70207.1 rhodanese-like domain-containing protein [Gammaproteobacteria bacterium]HAE72588.1 rhodanese-like domain-containing protein [Gammaproteobacteria bacterium]HAG47383.1 rhodanese-like domain-containing protein [Gammaproteobacteria bacterium]HAN33022.1 rhodanese-like domain-containing protein [Gammaproteobacteria bacterium]